MLSNKDPVFEENTEKSNSKKNNAVQGAQALHRAIHLLRLVASNTQEGIRLTDIASETKLTTPTVHRLLKALVSEKLLVKNKRSNHYHLGSLIYELGLASAQQFHVVDIYAPVLKILAHKTTATAILWAKSDSDAVCIIKEKNGSNIDMPSIFTGCRVPLGTYSGGTAILSALPEAEMEKILQANASRFQRYEGLTIGTIKERYYTSRQKGYTTVDRGNNTAFAMPITNQKGRPVGAIALLGSNDKFTNEYVTNMLLPYLNGAAHEIAAILGDNDTLLDIKTTSQPL